MTKKRSFTFELEALCFFMISEGANKSDNANSDLMENQQIISSSDLKDNRTRKVQRAGIFQKTNGFSNVINTKPCNDLDKHRKLVLSQNEMNTTRDANKIIFRCNKTFSLIGPRLKYFQKHSKVSFIQCLGCGKISSLRLPCAVHQTNFNFKILVVEGLF